MNTKPVALHLLACIVFAATGAAFAAGDHHAPKHGGVVVETKAADFEFVVKANLIQIYVSDHGKPMNIDGSKARVTLLTGSEKTEAELVQVGDKLEAKGTYNVVPKSTKGVAVVSLPGKPPVSARFVVR